MKYLVIFALFLVSSNALNPELIKSFMEKVTKFGEVCIAETKASSEDVARLMVHQTPVTHEGQCLVSCVYKKFKIQNEDGTMNKEEALKVIDKVKDDDPELYKKLITVLQNCHKPELIVDDPCLTATNVASCGVEESKKAGITSEMLGM